MVIYETDKFAYNFKQFERSFAKSIYVGNITLNDADKNQSDLLFELRKLFTKNHKTETCSISALYESIEMVINAFKNRKFPIRPAEGAVCPGVLASHLLDLASHLEILNPKQMLQSLPIALAQVKAGNTCENLLNEICQITYSLYRTK